MESLVNYESDEESGDYNDSGKSDFRSRQRLEEDANYDEIGMDESSEESNNNHAEGHFSIIAKDKQQQQQQQQHGEVSKSYSYTDSSADGCEQNYQGSNSELDGESNSKLEENGSCENSFNRFNTKQGKGNWENNQEFSEYEEAGSSRAKEETQRRHSSDMEMDDGEDDLDNYKCEDSKYADSTADLKHKFSQKNLSFTKGKNLGEDSLKKYEDCYQGFKSKSSTDRMSPKDSCGEKKGNMEEVQKGREDKLRQRDRGKDSEERRKDEYRRKDEKDNRKREEERWRENDREKRRESERYKEDRERKRSPDRREHGKKRSHSPDRRDRDREYERDRDRERDRERERERDRDRDRERDYRASDRRSPKHSRRSSRSPERSWKARKLEKKAAVLNKLGIEIKTDVTGNMTPRQLLGEQLKAQIQEVEAKTGVTLPTYYNPGVMNPLKYAQQIQKRKLLWGNKGNEAKTNEGTSQGSSVPSTVKQWEAATFKGDNDGKMTEKFKRLMGIKGDTATGNVGSTGLKPPETKEIIQKQEEMFSNMEAQYQVARMATHTHRGVGLGFGTFQVPPR